MSPIESARLVGPNWRGSIRPISGNMLMIVPHHGQAEMGRAMLASLPHVFDNREWALVIWLLVVLVFVLGSKRIRPSVVGAIGAFLHPKVFGFFLAMAAYVTGLVYLLRLFHIWTTDLAGATVFWFFGPATVLLFRLSDQKYERRFFRHTVLELFSFTVIFEFLVNAFPLNLLAEIVLVPVLVLLGGLVAVASTKSEYKQVRGCLTGVTVAAGLSFLGYAIYRIATDLDAFATLGTAREFFVPLLLTVGLVPFLYGAAVIFAYGTMLAFLRWKLDNDGLYRYARKKALLSARLRLRTVRALRKDYAARLVDTSSREDVDQAAARIKRRKLRKD